MDVKVFIPSQAMTFETVQADCQRLHQFCQDNKEPILNLQLSEVLQCDSAGLAFLIEAKRLCAHQNKTCNIIGLPQVVQALAEFCGVNEMLDLAV
ncbi:MAG: STAS domain-containing protein [Tatlockia sp.]|nr:STAS domain-containing protein [Tatlockia sp.]